jgi:hypothetical protein
MPKGYEVAEESLLDVSRVRAMGGRQVKSAKKHAGTTPGCSRTHVTSLVTCAGLGENLLYVVKLFGSSSPWRG